MIDTHAHLYACDRPLDELVTNAKNAGVTDIIHVAIDIEGAKQCVQSAKEYSMLHPTAGAHPCAVDTYDEAVLRRFIQDNSVVAVGEMGLDYYRMYHPKDIQLKAFQSQLELAVMFELPVIIHNRHSDEDMCKILKKYPNLKKVLHCYSSDRNMAETLLDADPDNQYFSFTASIIPSKKGKTIQALKQIPLDKIMIETDCPYLTPPVYKGQENQPAFVGEVLKKIADVKDRSCDDVLKATVDNTRLFFRL